MLEKKELTFVVFILHALGQQWNMTTLYTEKLEMTKTQLDNILKKLG